MENCDKKVLGHRTNLMREVFTQDIFTQDLKTTINWTTSGKNGEWGTPPGPLPPCFPSVFKFFVFSYPEYTQLSLGFLSFGNFAIVACMFPLFLLAAIHCPRAFPKHRCVPETGLSAGISLEMLIEIFIDMFIDSIDILIDVSIDMFMDLFLSTFLLTF